MSTNQRRALANMVPTTEVIKDAVTFPRERLGEPLEISPERFEAWLAHVRRDAAREAVLDLAEDYRLRAEEALSDEDTNLASTLTGEYLSIRERALTEYPEETP